MTGNDVSSFKSIQNRIYKQTYQNTFKRRKKKEKTRKNCENGF